MNHDLTVGRPARVLFRFCLPLFASVIFQQLYNVADSFVCGKFVGNDALAAVGNSYEITLLFIAFAFGCNIGCSVVVARLFGAKDYREMKTAVYTSLISIGVLCAVLMAIGLIFCEPFLRLIHTPENIMADSALYLRIYIIGLPFVFFYHIATGIFSALGDSRTPFYFLACSSLANIGMDILFVKSFGLGVAGVAYATFICQGISCILALFVIFRRLSKIETDGKPQMFSKPLLLDFLRVAVPSSLQQSFISVGNILIQDVINSFDSADIIAGYAAAIKLNNMAIGAILTFGNGMSNYVAQNIGAGKPERIREGFFAAWRMIYAICVPIALLYYFGSTALISLFLEEPTGEALETGVLFLKYVGPFYFLVSLKLLSDGVLRGTERMKAFMVATFSDLILRVVLAEILAPRLGVVGVFLPWPIGWTIGVGLSLLFSTKSMNKKPVLSE